MWTCETFVSYLDLLGGELRARRRALSLTIEDAALIICDSASQHSSLKFPSIKKEWMRQRNAVPLQSTSFCLLCVILH